MKHSYDSVNMGQSVEGRVISEEQLNTPENYETPFFVSAMAKMNIRSQVIVHEPAGL